MSRSPVPRLSRAERRLATALCRLERARTADAPTLPLLERSLILAAQRLSKGAARVLRSESQEAA